MRILVTGASCRKVAYPWVVIAVGRWQILHTWVLCSDAAVRLLVRLESGRRVPLEMTWTTRHQGEMNTGRNYGPRNQ